MKSEEKYPRYFTNKFGNLYVLINETSYSSYKNGTYEGTYRNMDCFRCFMENKEVSDEITKYEAFFLK